MIMSMGCGENGSRMILHCQTSKKKRFLFLDQKVFVGTESKENGQQGRHAPIVRKETVHHSESPICNVEVGPLE